MHNFCKKGPYRAEVATSEEIGAFDALSNTEHFVTFSGTTGLALTWDVSQSRGQALSSTHSGALKNARSGSFGFGLNVGRRRLETTDKGVPGYAFPTSGRVLAVSKKLLEVTPEALEERRRKLEDSTEEFTDQAHRKLPGDDVELAGFNPLHNGPPIVGDMAQYGETQGAAPGAAPAEKPTPAPARSPHQAHRRLPLSAQARATERLRARLGRRGGGGGGGRVAPEGGGGPATPDASAAAPTESATNPCRRRLDGTKLSDEWRRRLGATLCADFDGGTAASFSVSLGRAANKESGQTHAIAVSLGDGNAQDVFAVKISQDTVYGTPIFTTMGGRSSCVGETATTRRDSRVTIKEIKPLCSKNDPATGYPDSPLCASSFDCECNNLAPGEDAIFSVVLQNLSPWKTSVRYLLRAVNGGSMPWDSGKYARDFTDPSKVGCEDGDIGALEITAFGNKNLRDGSGIELIPLSYGQSEVTIRVKRPDFVPQCFS